jgi:hypothetical protein
MINKLIVFIHLLLCIFSILYVFLIKNKQYDYIYLIVIYFILLHWTFLKGECIISYLYKKMQNNDYEIGSNTKTDDLEYFFGEYTNYFHFFIQILTAINIYMLCKRNNIKYHVTFMFTFIYITFISLFHLLDRNQINQLYDIIKIILIFIGLYIYLNQDSIHN